MLHYFLTFSFTHMRMNFSDSMIRNGHRRFARSFNLCYRYNDDLIVFNDTKFLDHLKETYLIYTLIRSKN